ncbi:MAG: DUF2961 domain-containing protein [Phycisphaerae bacterium]|nr:DUF2961 domain-containing protein [Phycisphaerae bacterium]
MGLYQTPCHGCPLYHYHRSNEDPDDLVRMYRWHVKDPIRYQRSLDKVAIRQIGWKNGLYERIDEWSSVAYWYQVEPHNPFPKLPEPAARTANIDVVPKAEE